jgi:hypothetical protein
MNVYLVEEPGGSGVTVYDAGEKGMAAAIVAAAREFGGITGSFLATATPTTAAPRAPAAATTGG